MMPGGAAERSVKLPRTDTRRQHSLKRHSTRRRRKDRLTASYRFGAFEVRPAERTVRREGQSLAVGARGFDVLVALIERRDRLVSKDELLDLVWPGFVVEEANVQVQVSGLRKLLGAGAISTVPGRGYRFTAPLESDLPVGPAAGSPAADVASPAGAESAAPHRTNVPAAVEDLIGREADIAALSDALGRSRLVTLHGPGGIGKTRVAQEVARRRAGSQPGGVWFVDLSALTEPPQLATAIANAANLQLGITEQDASVELLRALAPRAMLLVLDNCEHLTRAVGALVEALHGAARDLRVLVTSQELLRIPGEHAFGLEPLAIPPPGLAFEVAQGYSALRLLEYRARSLDRRFALSATNLPVAIELVRRLDGNPLAIEMAAARVPLLGLETLASRLGERLLLLRNAARSALSRHQTLRATLEWSHALLDPREQAVLRRLSVFAGSFRVDTAQRAIAGVEMDEWAVLDALSALVDKSLVQTERLDPPRYRLLETMRLFCAEQLQRCGDAALAEQRHGAALAELAEAVERDFWEMSDAAWLARYAAEYDDLQVAFDRALGRRDVEVAATTGIALVRLDHLRSVNAPRLARAAALHALLPEAGPRARAWIWSCIASHGLLALDVVSRLEAANQAVAAWREQGDPMRLHFALGFLASESARARDFATAARMLDEVRALEDPSWPMKRLMWGASVVAGVCIHLDDAQGYRDASRRELAFAEKAGADRAAAWARLKLADAALMAGDCAEAIALGRAAVDELRILDQPSNMGLALSNLCAALLLEGDRSGARAAAAEALPLLWRNGWHYLLLDSIAYLAALEGRADAGARLLGVADAWYTAHGDERQPNEARLARRAAAAIAAALGDVAATQARMAGRALDESAAQALAAEVVSAGQTAA
jgi:predicted ATPase/DNA-binding winged helix-turn-helix (wHTH) protein